MLMVAFGGSSALIMPLSRAASRHAPGAWRIAACAASSSPADLPPLPSGFIVVDKPPGWTSFDVVGKVRGTLERDLKSRGHTFRRRSRLKVGHGGTLDPLATGLLVLGVGGGTKLLDAYLRGAKGYAARARLGAETDTQDSEGAVLSEAAHAHVTRASLEAAAAALTGEILQRPPIYSALRRDGVRLHELARAGKVEETDVEPRAVTVHALRLEPDYADGGAELGLRVVCSGGTYVRTLIVDLARAVDSAGHMTALERTRVGPFCSAAHGVDESGGEAAAAPPPALVAPVGEADLGDAERLYAAIAEADDALKRAEALKAAQEPAVA